MLLDARSLGVEPTGVGQYTEALIRGGGGRVRPVVWPRSWRRVRRLGSRPVVVTARFDRRLPPAAVLHAPDFQSDLVVPGAARVATVHDFSFLRFPDLFPPGFSEDFARRFRASLAHVDLVLCDSESTRADLRSFHPHADDWSMVVPLGVDDRYLGPRRPADEDQVLGRLGVRRPFLLHAGALTRRKNLPVLLEAFAQVRQVDPDLSLVLVGVDARGWASHSDHVTAWVAERAAGKAVRVLGYVDEQDMPHLYRAAAAYVTTTHWEGFGLPIAQAMAVGRPVVAPRHSSIPEVGGDLAFYVDHLDPSDVARAIGEARAEREGSDRLRQGAARAAGFTWDRTVRRTFEGYELAIRRSTR